MTQLTKRKSLIVSVGLLMSSMFGFGLGVASLFSMLGINSILSGTIASQLAILMYALSLFDFNIKHLKSVFNKKLNGKLIVIAVSSTIIAIIINQVLDSVTSNIIEDTKTTAQLLVEKGFLLSFFLPVIVAPIVEELSFRAGIKRILVDNGGWRPSAYVLFSSFLFGIMHLGAGVMGLAHVALTFSMGVIYSTVYLKTNNIYATILSHMLYNGVIMILTALLV